MLYFHLILPVVIYYTSLLYKICSEYIIVFYKKYPWEVFYLFVVLARTVILYIIVVTVMRLMGKRQIGELQPYELATAIMISELAAVPMQDMGIPLINGIVTILVLLICQFIISFVSMKNN